VFCLGDSEELGIAETMKTLGKHLLCELTGCSSVKLSGVEWVKKEIYAAAFAAKATVLHGYFHQFAPTGVSGMLCLAESHISIHTWPETGYAAIDIYTCGETAMPHKAIEHLVTAFEADQHHIVEMARGVHDDGGRYVSVPVDKKNQEASESAEVLKNDLAPRPAKPHVRSKYKPVPID
jgi:S-adenosylmethionine decarboxylase